MEVGYILLDNDKQFIKAPIYDIKYELHNYRIDRRHWLVRLFYPFIVTQIFSVLSHIHFLSLNL